MSFLITGAQGLLGSHIIRGLQEKGHSVIATSRNPESAAQKLSIHPSQILKVDFEKDTPEQVYQSLSTLSALKAVVHCASGYTEVPLTTASCSLIESYSRLYANDQIIAQFALSKLQSCRIIFLGSTAGRENAITATPYGLYKHSLRALSESVCLLGKEKSVSATHVLAGSFSEDLVAADSPQQTVKVSDIARKIIEILETSPETVIPNIEIVPSNSIV